MSGICGDVRNLLADHGSTAPESDEAVRSHLEGCMECRAFRSVMESLDEQLGELPEIQPPRKVVEDLLAKVASRRRETAQVTGWIEKIRRLGTNQDPVCVPDSFATRVGATFGVSIVLYLLLLVGEDAGLLAIFLLKAIGFGMLSALAVMAGIAGMRMEYIKFGVLSCAMIGAATLMTGLDLAGPELLSSTIIAASAMALLTILAASPGFRGTVALAGLACSIFISRSMISTFFNDTAVSGDGGAYITNYSERSTRYNDMRISEGGSGIVNYAASLFDTETQKNPRGLERLSADEKGAEEAKSDILDRLQNERERETFGRLDEIGKLAGGAPQTGAGDAIVAAEDLPFDPVPARTKGRRKIGERPAAGDASERRKDETSPKTSGAGEPAVDHRQRAPLSEPPAGSSSSLGGEILRRFRQSREQTEGIPFVEPRGYWSNSYLPGDPIMIDLARKLRASSDGRLESPHLDLGAPAVRAVQPFDAPQSSALSLYLHSDRSAADGKARMLVQVGIQATRRSSGTRPSMNVALVLDMRGDLPEAERERLRSLVVALEKAREAGDRFSLTVAGREGGILIKPGEFRHGTVDVALRQLFGTRAPSPGGLGLVDAFRSAAASAKQGDDPSGPPGSSMLILATSQPLNGVADTLAALAHESAVNGVPVSVVSAGTRALQGEIEGIALAGQGNRRYLDAPSEAARVIERELTSLARVVARAIRLRIRLSPDVKLVGVLGSRRLDDAQAEAVREAEKSIDRRVARSLGIAADRGDDEDGIQIVIPAFHSGDSHVILLDVVAPGPGPIAEVSARYKDLVFSRNGVASAHLSLARGDGREAAGPLELNVLKNLLALHLSGALERAGQKLAASEWQESSAIANYHLALLDELREQLPRLRHDADIAKDAEMLREYLRLTEELVSLSLDPYDRDRLSSSMRLGGRMKVLPAPFNED